MSLTDLLFDEYVELDESQADRLKRGTVDQYTVEVKPPRNGDIPSTLETFVQGIRELQTKWFGLVNTSPVITYEIRRSDSDRLRFQFSVPTRRLERKLRTQLQTEIPEIRFDTGTDGLPVSDGDSIGGGLLTLGRDDWYPLRTSFDDPPINALSGALHRHAMQDTRIIIQILFRPVIGHPIRRWWRTRNAYKQVGYLRKEKPRTVPWHNRPATPRERQQADAIERKTGTSNFDVAIRFLIVGAREHTPSRVKELSGAFNLFESPDTGQYLDTVTVKNLRKSRLIEFADAVNTRRLEDWSLPFQASIPELAALVSLPDRSQQNIQYANP